jgi:hypothetical protein
VSAQSNVEGEDFVETLVAAGVLPAARLKWIRKHTGAEESEVEALIGAGTISRAEVDAHHRVHIQHLIGAGLCWSQTKWTWTPIPEASARFEVSLLPSVNGLEGLITGVLGSFDLGSLHTFIDAGDAGDFLADARLTNGEQTWLPADMAEICTVMSQNMDRSAMTAQLQCDQDRLAALLWILEATGWAHRAHPPAALVPLGTVATILAGDTAKPSAATESAAPAPAPAPPEEPALSKAATDNETTTPNTQAVQDASSSPPETISKTRTASQKSPTKKAPAKKKTQRTDVAKRLKQALEAVETEDFDGAYPQLITVRKERPSCPDTLAALGWCAWRTGNLGSNAYDGPEDYLLLALTFDAAHPKALEYYARIAIDQGQTETARNRLLQVLKVTPTSSWAQQALDECAPSSRKGGLRLWPKGKS